MKGITYSALRGILAALEPLAIAPPASVPQSFPSYKAVRQPTQGSQVQAYGLDRQCSANDLELPVVVAVGGNYTQAKARVPRDNKPPLFTPPVEDDLRICRAYLKMGFKHFDLHRPRWFENCVASSTTLPFFRDDGFHLVMTNLCLWITRNAWQNIGSAFRADLLENNPFLGGNPTSPGQWAHLTALAYALRNCDVIWVGHGMHSEVFAIFRLFMRSLVNPDWLLLPNLAYHYDYNAWNLLKGNTEENHK